MQNLIKEIVDMDKKAREEADAAQVEKVIQKRKPPKTARTNPTEYLTRAYGSASKRTSLLNGKRRKGLDGKKPPITNNFQKSWKKLIAKKEQPMGCGACRSCDWGE